MILKSQDLVIENILLKKQISTGNDLYNIPIKYLNNNLIIQTPIIYIPFDINRFKGQNYLDISFLNSEVDKEMNIFRKKIENINDLLIKLINKKYKKLKFINSIKKSDSIFSDRLRLTIEDNILIYNDKKKLIDFEYVKGKNYAKLLISPLFIWKNNSHFGIKWYILQVKMYQKLILETYSFIDDDEEQKEKSEKLDYKSHPKYSKYFKMLNCGVPKEAVKHKMILDNLDPNILDGKIDDKNDKKEPKQIIKPKINLLDIINANKKIKKNNNTDENILNKKNNTKNNMMFRPTMSDILNQKNKLKKINIK